MFSRILGGTCPTCPLPVSDADTVGYITNLCFVVSVSVVDDVAVRAVVVD